MRGRRKAINAGVPASKREPRPPAQGGRSPRGGNNRGGRGGGDHSGGGAAERRKQREQAAVTEPDTWKTIRRETRASTNLKFRPLERAIGAEIRASRQRQGEVGDWWQNYLNTVSQGQADTSAAYQQAGAAQQAQIGQASAIDTANTARLQGEAAKSAELRGVAPSAAPAEREAAAQAQRNYLASAQAGTTALQGATQRGYLNEQKRIGVGQGIKSRLEEQRRERGYRKDRRETRKERGEYAATKRGELRKEARDYLIQRQAFGLDKQKAAQEAREGAAERAQSERQSIRSQEQDEAASRRTAQSNVRSNRQDERASKRSAKGEGGGGKGGVTEGQRNAAATAKSLFEEKEWSSWTALERKVRKESEVSPSEARWAVAQLRKHVEGEERRKAKEALGHSHR
jgi:hypothetical protein